MKTSIALLISTLFLLTSCGNPECERGEGRMISETFDVSSFDAVDISSWGDVEIVKSHEHKVEVHAQPNVINRFRINVRNETLHVGADCFNSNSRPKLIIYTNDLKVLRFTGAGNVESSSHFVSDNFEVELTGSGDVRLRGETTNLSIKVSGSGDVKLFDMKAESAEVRISGVSKCEVFVEKYLNVKISGSGKVYYHGYPEIEQEISGNGKIISGN